jgi:hypothetical protein
MVFLEPIILQSMVIVAPFHTLMQSLPSFAAPLLDMIDLTIFLSTINDSLASPVSFPRQNKCAAHSIFESEFIIRTKSTMDSIGATEHRQRITSFRVVSVIVRSLRSGY